MYYDKAAKIVEYILINGGNVANAARELEIKLTPKIRESVYEMRPDVDRYRYAFKRHGNWFVLPSDKAATRDAQKVDAVCLLCNRIFPVSLINIEAGRSRQCQECGMKHRSHKHIHCEETGDTFTSIRQFAHELGQHSSYQAIRHSLRNTGCYEFEGKSYSFV